MKEQEINGETYVLVRKDMWEEILELFEYIKNINKRK